MSKILIGAATAGLWFALSYAAHAERACRQVCDHGACVSRCMEQPGGDVVVRDHDRRPGVDIRGPGVDIDVGH